MSGIGGFAWLAAIVQDRLSPPADPKPDLAGTNIIVTGSNVGVGFEAAVKFVALGAEKVILGVRSLKKGEDAKAKIEERSGRKGVVEVWQLDMMDCESVRAFAKRVEGLEHLEVACLNAGVANMGFERGVYGWEGTLQVNTISTALLAILLLPELQASRTATFTPVLELVSSGNHTQVAVKDEARKADSPLEVYNEPANFDGLVQYSISKLFLQFVQTGLVKQLGPVEKASVELVTICPGATKSELARGDLPFALRMFQKLFYHLLMKPTEQGARTYVGAIELRGKGHGQFFQHGQIKDPAPTLIGPENEILQEKVWEDVRNALRKDIPEVDRLLSSLKSQQ